MEEYIEAKMNIFRHQDGGLAVFNAGDPHTARILSERKGKVALFGWSRPENPAKRLIYFENGQIICEDMAGKRAMLDTKDIRIPGRHNVENYMCAIAATIDLASPTAIRRVAKNFAGVPHRIEFVREFNGASYYNDSIASSPTRTIAGLHSFGKRLLLIAGGYDKHIPFEGLGVEIADHVKCLYLTGHTAGKIRTAVESASNYDPEKTKIVDCGDMAEAVRLAAWGAEKGDVVMLSPACASFDAYKNFEKRGEHFKELVLSLRS
jgi:UDP-N-acetylmuramoylalanine--D-glutamate ligase